MHPKPAHVSVLVAHAAVLCLLAGCHRGHEPIGGPRERSDAGAWSDAGALSDAAVDAPRYAAPDATFDAARRPPPEGCPSFADAGTAFEPDPTWDGGPHLERPVRGVSIASDGTSFGVVWEDDATIQFARVTLDGAVLARTTLDSGGGGRLLPAIAWNGERHAVTYQSARAEMSWVEVDADGRVLSPPRVAASDVCAFRAPLVWSGDRWTRVTVTDSEPNHGVVTQIVPGVGAFSHVLDDVVANACDTIGAAWNGAGFGVVWSDWTEANSRMGFLRLDAAGAPIEGSLRFLYESRPPGRSVQGHDIVWTGSDYIAGGALSPYARVSAEGELLSELPATVGNEFLSTLEWTGCAVATAFVVHPSFSYGYTWMTDEPAHPVVLGYGYVENVALALGPADEAGFVMAQRNGVFFRRIGPLAPIGEWQPISTALSP